MDISSNSTLHRHYEPHAGVLLVTAHHGNVELNGGTWAHGNTGAVSSLAAGGIVNPATASASFTPPR